MKFPSPGPEASIALVKVATVCGRAINTALTITTLNGPALIRSQGKGAETDMGIIIEFPADAGSRRPGSPTVTPTDRTAQILILPVIRIERHAETGNDGGPERGDAPGRRRRRRARS